MSNETTNSAGYTSMGNVCVNPRGVYNDDTMYDFLDMVSFDGGSYICLKSGTIGVRPETNMSTENWFCSSIPGSATEEFTELVQTIQNLARAADISATNAGKSASAAAESATEVSKSKDAAETAAANAESAKDVVAGYKNAAEKAKTAAEQAEQNVENMVAGLDQTFEEKTESAIQEINQAVSGKAEEIEQEIAQAKDDMVGDAEQAVNKVIDLRKAEINSTGAEQINAVKSQGEIQVENVNDTAADQIAALNAAGGTLESAVERYYAMRRGREIYTVEELDSSVTQACTVNRLDGLEGLSCTPSTNETAGVDQIGTLEAFKPLNVNWILDENGNQKITAIEGMPGYKKTGKINRGVMNMGLYYKKERNAEDNGWLHHWSMLPREEEGYRPLSECVRPDGTVQGWMIHPKGLAVDIDGIPYVTNGNPIRKKASFANFAYARKQGAAYCFETDADACWILALTMIKYGTTDIQAYMKGCTSYNYQYQVTAAEENVKRVIISTSQANNLEIGSCVSVGLPDDSSNLDRYNDYMHNVADSAMITKIETYDDTNSAVYLDVETPITTTTGCYLSTMHWRTGSTDAVKGYDGSPVSNTNGKDICKINEIEIMPGGLSVSGNSVHIIETDAEGNTACTYYKTNDSRDLTTNLDTIASSFENCGTFPHTNNAWAYIKDQNVDFGKGIMVPVEFGGGSNTYWADGWHTGSVPAAGQKSGRELLRRGVLPHGGIAGASYVRGNYGLSNVHWPLLATLSPNAVRGEWQAAA